MTTCTACERSKSDPTNDMHWSTITQCIGCKARALASLGEHAREALAEEFTPAYRETLERLFGDRWQQGHGKVKDWTQRIAAAAAQAKASKVTT